MAEHHRPSPPTPAEATEYLLARRHDGGARTIAIVVLGVLAIVGLVALAAMIASGPEPRSKWGFPAAGLAFILGTAHAAPILAFATRLAKGLWAIPLRRAAELWGVVGLVSTPLYIVLLLQLPSFLGRPSIWFNWPGSPQIYDGVMIIILSLCALALLFINAVPDFAAARDAGDRGWARRLALGWVGSPRQWVVLTGGIVVLGAFYVMVYAYVHLFISADMAMSLVPGWKSSIFPPYHAVSGFQSGIALILITLWFMRNFGGLERYITVEQFWGAAKLLLATSLLFFYFTWSEHLLPWYGRLPLEILYLELLFWGPYKDLFLLSFAMNFVLPFAFLIWNRVRVSVGGPAYVAAIVVVGNFIDRSRIYLASWSVAAPVGTPFHVPPTNYPGPLEVLVVLGALSAVVALFLLATRLIPPISIWEYKTSLMLHIERPYVASEVAVVAKPR
jgi:molybdopterin-containing oxidoreductase family membrane subunit